MRDPHVVQIHDVGESNGCLYLVLEYVPGGSLKERLDGPLPAAAAALLVEKIAAGVAAIHRSGLLHLDLKPSNILLDSDQGAPWESSSPKVADFGIAREADDVAMTRTTLCGPWGTPSYMAPEQVEPGRLTVGQASDVYALGAILYELLSGRPPFCSASLAETMDQIRHQEAASPASEFQRPVGPGHYLHDLPQKRFETALRHRRRPGGRPAALAGGPADRGATGLGCREGLAVGAAPSYDRGARVCTRGYPHRRRCESDDAVAQGRAGAPARRGLARGGPGQLRRRVPIAARGVRVH